MKHARWRFIRLRISFTMLSWCIVVRLQRGCGEEQIRGRSSRQRPAMLLCAATWEYCYIGSQTKARRLLLTVEAVQWATPSNQRKRGVVALTSETRRCSAPSRLHSSIESLTIEEKLDETRNGFALSSAAAFIVHHCLRIFVEQYPAAGQAIQTTAGSSTTVSFYEHRHVWN